MLDAIENLADVERMGDAAGRCLIVHDHDRFDLVLAVGSELGLDLLKVGAVAPVAGQEIDVEFEFFCNAAPQHGELAGLGHQHLVARGQRVDDRSFPGTGTGRGIDDHRLLGSEYPLHRSQHRMSDLGEFGTAVVHGRHVHGAQHPVRHIGRSRNLQKMPSRVHSHGSSFPVLSWFREPLEYHYLAGLSLARRGPSMHKKQGFALPRRTPAGKTFRPTHEIEPMAATGAEKSPNSAENSGLAARLAREITGDVFFDTFNCGRYATDASFYQILPFGVVVPRTMDEALRTLAICRDEGRIVTPRGGGTSQCGQTVNEGLVVDFSKHLNHLLSLDVANRTCVVEPGIVLDDLNRQLKKHGLWFPVDVSTASRATIGGMAGNNSCGGRSLRYGTMRDNTLSLEASLADGTLSRFGEVSRDLSQVNSSDGGLELFRDMLDLGAREAAEIAEKFPKVQRRVGGYNLDALVPRNSRNNMAHLLVGSEGTLAFTTRLELKLWPVIRNKVLGVCHFGSFYEAMDAAQHLVKLKPIAVELVDG